MSDVARKVYMDKYEKKLRIIESKLRKLTEDKNDRIFGGIHESCHRRGHTLKESVGRAKKVCEDGECWYEVEVDPNSDENTVVDCKFCGDTYLFKGLDETLVYNRSRNIQDILPNLEPEYREIFISGICPKCWDKMFGDEEDE